MLELVEAQVGNKIARRNINNLRYADDTTLMAESEEAGKVGGGQPCGHQAANIKSVGQGS